MHEVSRGLNVSRWLDSLYVTLPRWELFRLWCLRQLRNGHLLPSERRCGAISLPQLRFGLLHITPGVAQLHRLFLWNLRFVPRLRHVRELPRGCIRSFERRHGLLVLPRGLQSRLNGLLKLRHMSRGNVFQRCGDYLS